jgi:hypothetical protein
LKGELTIAIGTLKLKKLEGTVKEPPIRSEAKAAKKTAQEAKGNVDSDDMMN